MARLAIIRRVVIQPIRVTDGADIPRPGIEAGDGLTVAYGAAFVCHRRVNLLDTLPVTCEAVGLGLVVWASAKPGFILNASV